MAIGRPSLPIGLVRSGLESAVRALFAAGEPGWWYDSNDLSTMSQDNLGATPVYQPGQGSADPLVGRHMDKSGRGNHRTQGTGGSRPKLSGRYNLLVGSAALATQDVTTLAASYRLSFVGSGTITLSGTSTAGPLVGGGSLTFTPTAGLLTLTVTGSVTLADLRLTADTLLSIPAYQSVVDANTYDTNGFPLYLMPDGTDDFMTSSVNMSATDKMTVCAALTKISDAASSLLFEASIDSGASSGTYAVFAPGASPVQARFRSRGTVSADAAISAGYTAPIPLVLTGQGDIAGDSAILRLNSTQVANVATDQGTGNYGNFTVYHYSRAGSASRYGSRDYGQIVRGAASSAAQVSSMETWAKTKMRYLYV